MASALSLIIDINNPSKSGILESFDNKLPSSVPLMVRNNTEAVSLRFVEATSSGSAPWQDVDYSDASVVLGIGDFDATASVGVFTLTFGADTTTGLPAESSEEAVAYALNILPSIIAAGLVSVTSPEDGVYAILFLSNGAQSAVSCNVAGLSPAVIGQVAQLTTGATSNPSLQLIQMFAAPYALNSTWTYDEPELTGTLNLSTLPMIQKFMIAGLDVLTLNLEIQVTPSGEGQGTVLLVPIQVSKNVLNYNSFSPPPVPAFSGSIPMDSGITEYTATGLSLISTPSLYLVTLLKLDPNDDNVWASLRAGFTADGFTVDFTEPLPNANYILKWVAIYDS